MTTPLAISDQLDLSNCDREPIHLLGQIQHFGYLVAVSMDWIVQHVSANIEELFGRQPDDMLGCPLAEILPDGSLHLIRGKLQLIAPNEGCERVFSIDFFGDGRYFDIAVHISNTSIVIELERSESNAASNGNPGMLLKAMVARIQRCDFTTAVFRECVRQLRAVTGFDRVMLYRFAESGSGAVVAESLNRNLEPFLGLNYPATDIPRQARQLYLRNRIRIIADVDSQNIDIVPQTDPSGAPLDLSLSVTRAVSPIHVEYLKNMGVHASLSISVVIDDKLWGLFALHNYTPRLLSMEMRSTMELFGEMASLIIEGRLGKETRRVEEEARDLNDRVVAKLISTSPTMAELIDFAEDFRELIPCDGFAVWAKDVVRTVGQCPFPDDMPGLARFLNRAASSRVYATDELSSVYPKAAEFVDRAAGLLAIPISRAPRDYLLFFRKEIVETVTWAGRPDEKPVEFGPNGPRLTPRKSFEAWQETVRGKCRPWSPARLKAAEALRVSILEVLLRFNEETERQQKLASQHQELLIAELNHRVRNILSLMRALVVQSRASAESVDDFSTIIGGRIQALARAHDQITDDNYKAQSLRAIMQTEIEAYIGPKASRVHLDGPVILVEAKAFSTLALVFHEMVTNSAKYGALSDSRGNVRVSWRIDDNENCEILWRESDGPPVKPPSRRGFGSTIIERSIPHDLGGEVSVEYHLTGLKARFVLPSQVFQLKSELEANIEETDYVHKGYKGQDVLLQSRLAGKTGLILEDNMIISLDAEQMLLEKGAKDVITAMSVSEAKRIVDRHTIDIALLDVNLGNETSFSLVPALEAKAIPYVFVTGYGEKLELPDHVDPRTEAVKKPFATEQLVAALDRALARREG
ncbi:GAF domain-containing protein [Jiella sp. MQZ9-1]|uniref:Blue-light-activated histidine kinase n=1 Tax=Jiella flava TaxID=2816857 RepID=A0A939G1G2_9HYPH|nr:HWE histidine kinase domain-containing protein [Jiella flava]MBO0664105.1 GAF domain-containing protein [Jiella flava]MCD2472676.1 GAF domain-containing protein [Jiella flava]